MSSTLHDQLHRLAERAEPAPDGRAGRVLWDRGIRYRRRRRAGTLAIAGVALAALAVLAGVTVQQTGPDPAPAPTDAPVGLPSRIYEPSRWLPGTEAAGPVGRVIAILPADRGHWTGTTPGVVAISAATGDYRFLDLPRRQRDEDVALSPDGRHVAYWATGSTMGTPNTQQSAGPPVAALAVYDTTTGATSVHTFRTEHGLSPENLAWVDSMHVVANAYHWVGGDDANAMAQSTADQETWWTWDIGEPEPRGWTPGRQGNVDSWSSSSAGGRVVARTSGRFLIFGAAPPAGVPTGAVRGASRVSGPGYAISPDGTRVAGIWNGRNSRIPNNVVVVPLAAADPAAASVRLPEEGRPPGKSFEVEGWTDDRHVAVTRRTEPVSAGLGMGIYEVDATTGASSLLVRLPEGRFNGAQWASDLLGAPVVDRPAPPTPLDPRWPTGLAIATALAGATGLWGWRRRVTP